MTLASRLCVSLYVSCVLLGDLLVKTLSCMKYLVPRWFLLAL